MRIKSFYEWTSLNESMNVYVQDYDFSNDVADTFELANWLQKNTVYKLWDDLTDEQQQTVQQKNMPSQIITTDGQDDNVLNFYTAGWPETLKQEIIKQVKALLDQKGIKYGPFKEEKSGMLDSNVVRMPILQMKATENAPPDINMANANAMLIFRDLLGFKGDEGGFSDIGAYELLTAVDRIKKNPHLMDIHARDPYQSQTPGGPQMYHGGLDKDSIARRLDQIGQIAQWAISNGYQKLYVA
jgi:hypothetical protein